MDDYLLSVAETAKRLGIKSDRCYVYKLIEKGYLKAIKLKSLKVRNSELNRFLKEFEGKDLSNLDDIKELQGEKHEQRNSDF